tara:strand:- start:50 stop:622 length:573 start_codon:yes stop_codon:yes gene_type:complete
MDRKEYHRLYRLKNKERLSEKGREYYLKNKEKKKEYYLKNKETILSQKKAHQESARKYKQTPKGIRSRVKCKWRKRGVIGDLDAIYDIYLATNECMRCSVPISGRNKHMDHDHETRLYRAILCNSCNTGNPLDLKCSKNNKSTGIKNITEHNKGRGYEFQKTTKGVPHSKYFKTLEEAVKYKEQYLSEIR